MLARDSLVQAGLPDNPYARQLRNGFRWLRFEKELENEFREFLSWNSLMQRRAAIGVAFLIWALFIVADWMMVDIRLHPSLFEQLLGVRLGMIGLLLVVWPAAFLPSLRKVGDAIAPYCLLLINLAVLACDVLFEWHGVPRFTQLGATLGILAVFFPLGLAFWACVRLALLCLALNLAVFLLFGGEENLRTNLLNTLYNGLVVLICSFALYLQDYAQREQFLGRRLLGMMAEQDSLTGLVNRRYYELLAQRALEQGAREEKGVALILVDVDDFKAYNDHYGHPAGDAALRQLGGGVRRVALRQRGGQHPGHRRAPAAGGGGAGHRAPGLQRRPLPDHQPGGGLFDLRHGPGRALSRGRPRALRGQGCRAQRGARGVPAARPPRIEETKKGARGRLSSYGTAQPWLGILQSCRL
ncbi:GGDEF domain-containing protein [Pseudomonas aeruginosa]